MLPNTPPLWHGRGSGGQYAPNPKALEALLAKRLQARGAQGNRTGCLFTSIDIDQARGYRKTDDDIHLFQVTPQAGSTLSWLEGSNDAVLAMETFFKDLWHADTRVLHGARVGALLDDTHGNVDTLNTYAVYKRQKRALTALLDAFLDAHPLRETPTDTLGAHQGEVWITGPVLLTPHQDTLCKRPSPNSKNALIPA